MAKASAPARLGRRYVHEKMLRNSPYCAKRILLEGGEPVTYTTEALA